MSRFSALKARLGKLQKLPLMVGVGCSLIAIIVFLIANNGRTNVSTTALENQGNDTQAKQTADVAAVAGTATSTPDQNPASQNTAPGTPGMTNSKPTSSPGSTQPSTSASQPTRRPDYNLNDVWYLATAGVAGLYNTCWPTPLTEANEAQCGDPNHAYSQALFSGVGISRNPDTAQALASDDAHQKATANHVEPKRGGGDGATVLTEALCAQYALSCGRW